MSTTTTTATCRKSRRRLIVFYRILLEFFSGSLLVLDCRRLYRRCAAVESKMSYSQNFQHGRNTLQVSREYKKRFSQLSSATSKPLFRSAQKFKYPCAACGFANQHKKNILFKLKFEFSNFLPSSEVSVLRCVRCELFGLRGDDDNDRFDEKIHETYVTTARGKRLAIGHVSQCAPFVFYVGYSIFFGLLV